MNENPQSLDASIAFDSAPVAKVDRQKLLQYAYLLQEDYQKQEQLKAAQDNASVPSSESNNNDQVKFEDDEFKSMDSESNQDQDDDDSGGGGDSV